jgi:hypothetical protein
MISLDKYSYLDPTIAMRVFLEEINKHDVAIKALVVGGGSGGEPAPVTSVAGKIGDVTLVSADITDLAAALDALTARVAALEATVASIVPGAVHYVRIVAENTLNNAVANGAVLRFDTIEEDTDGFAPTATPFSAVTIPAGLGGVYTINGWSSGSGNQSTTLGMGIIINSTTLTGTNQSISGPASVNYTLDNAAVSILRLNDGDTIELVNMSVSGGTNAFTAVFLSLVRIETGLMFK